jgi:Fe-S cluster assembly protein SufD
MSIAEASERYEGIIRDQFEHQTTHTNTWLERIKRNARQAFSSMDFPDRKQEAWRYTGTGKLLEQAFIPARPRSSADTDTRRLIEPIAGLDSYRLVFIDNRFRIEMSDLDALPEGVYIRSLRQDTEQSAPVISWLESSTIHNRNRFTALGTALLSDGIVVHLDAGVKLDKPLELIFLVTSRNDAVFSSPRVLMMLSDDASADLIERYCGYGQHVYFQNVVEEIIMHPNARLQHYRLVEESNAGRHLSTIHVQQHQGSRYSALNLQLTGVWIRSDIEIEMNGRNAECELNGLYTVVHGQQNDVHVNVIHHAPGCKSRQHYKGLLMGKGRAVFDGKIVVDREAQHTDAHLANDNLMLSDDAEVDTKPQLEIYADDVKCGHGTTVGQLDPEQLFYLRSRGISEADAHRMLCQGFASDILAKCNIDALRIYVESRFQTLPGTNTIPLVEVS